MGRLVGAFAAHKCARKAGDKNISILHLSYRTSDLQFSLVLQTHACPLKVYAIKNIRE